MYNIDDLIAFAEYKEADAKTWHQLLQLARDNNPEYQIFLLKQEEKENGRRNNCNTGGCC